MIIKGKIIKIGNSYALSIKKALIDAKILQLGEEIEVIFYRKIK